MRQVNVILLLLMMVIATLPVSADEVKNEVFSINLPAGYAAFIKQVQKQKSPDGEITATNWISKSPAGGAIVVTMSQMPGKILDPRKMMTSTRQALVNALGASLEQEEMREGAVPSARLLFHSDDAFFRSRLVIDVDRLYQLLFVARTAEQRVSPAATQIFESFRITERVPAQSGVAATAQ